MKSIEIYWLFSYTLSYEISLRQTISLSKGFLIGDRSFNTSMRSLSTMDLDELNSPPFKDPGLSQLQGQIKNVMIPLLIKVFQLRLEVQQTTSPPSRLYSAKPKFSLEELISQLNRLDEDLKLLHIWNQSCQTQLAKVLQEAKLGTSSSLCNSIKPDYTSHPAVQKSFECALLSGKKKPRSSSLSFWKKWMQKIAQRNKVSL